MNKQEKLLKKKKVGGAENLISINFKCLYLQFVFNFLMGFSAVCSFYKYLLIRDISGKSEETVQLPFHLDISDGVL